MQVYGLVRGGSLLVPKYGLFGRLLRSRLRLEYPCTQHGNHRSISTIENELGEYRYCAEGHVVLNNTHEATTNRTWACAGRFRRKKKNDRQESVAHGLQ